MLEDKVPVLEISKVSPDIIAAWKYPKLFKNTVHNQFMRCSKYYVPTTIESVLPLIKNPEHFSDLEQIKYKKSVCHELRVIKDEAQKFIGNVDLTKRTRGQQNQNCTSTKVSSTKPSSTVLRKRKLSIENKAPPAKKNVQASHNNPHFVLEDTDCINLCNPTSLSSDIEAEPVEAVPEITVPKKCKPSAKVNPNNLLYFTFLTNY